MDIFVFGSNLAGVHGAGSARAAVEKYGAEMGNGVGRQGASYAIPTKDADIQTMPLDAIGWFVEAFIKYAEANTSDTFNVVAIGCGLAGYTHQDIAPMFADAPKNCKLPPEWDAIIQDVLAEEASDPELADAETDEDVEAEMRVDEKKRRQA